MRTTAMLLLAALLVAGCAQLYDSTTISPTPTPSPTQGGQGIAVGEPHPGGGAAVQPPRGEATENGTHLVGQADRAGFSRGGSATFVFNATNLGADARTPGFCDVPYAFTLRDANGKELPLKTPQVRCLAYSEDAFPHGRWVSFSTTWNGTYAQGDHYVQASEGAYTFTATFRVLRPDGGHEVHVSLALPINILAMGQR
ncbi:MAG TPA: hypothetical protein VM286_01550 [Candidatus Thermoplasmatota archaeon]|nr:hypothetical protein [Candidatus Thermoplasmatota archaeon]